MDILAEAGVDVIFGLPGGAIAPLFDALLDRPEIRLVSTRHESTAMFAAAGFARATGRLGVVLVTSGPGVLNCMTGLASARADGLPVLLLAGEVARPQQGRGALQEGSAHFLNIVGVASHLSKLAFEIPTATSVPNMLRRAVATALSGKRGPVTVTLPLDVSSAAIVPSAASLHVHPTFQVDESILDRTAAALTGRRAVVFAGSGMRWDDGPKWLRKFAVHTQIPVMTTPKGKGVFPESHPLSLGVFGLGGHPSAQEYVAAGVDAVLAVGTSLSDLATNGWSQMLTPRVAFIHVDIEAAAVGRNYEVDMSIIAPASTVLRELTARMPRGAPLSMGVRYHAESVKSASGCLTSPQALREIQQILPADTIYCVDSGEHSIFATHYLRIDYPDAYVAMTGLGSMGSSLSAIGVQLGKPGRRVAIICGDGGFAMLAPELSVVATEQMPLRVFVMNDGRLGMVERGMRAHFSRNPSFSTLPFDIVTGAISHDVSAFRVRKPSEILAAEATLARLRGPAVIDVCIDPSIGFPKNARLSSLEQAMHPGNG